MAFLPADRDEPLRLRASTVAFGAAQVIRVGGSSIRALRGPRQIAALPAPSISVVHVRRGAVIARQGLGTAHTFGRTGDLLLLDLSEPVEILCSGGFQTLAMQVSLEDLGLTAGVVRSAAREYAPTRSTSGLLTRHLARMVSRPGIDAGDAARQVLGDTAMDLLRSVVAEAVDPVGDVREVLDQTLATRLQQYILAHLSDPTLTPERIAREHFISTRKLYYIWSDHEENLTEWIIQRRLEAAHMALTSNARERISDVARTCGFVNTPHFNRRYRQRFGESPRDTQVMADSGDRQMGHS